MKRILVLCMALLLPLSLVGQNDKVFRMGIDASLDCFLSGNHSVTPSFGLGARARVGRPDQWLNLVGGVRYIYGQRLSGLQVPVLARYNFTPTIYAEAGLNLELNLGTSISFSDEDGTEVTGMTQLLSAKVSSPRKRADSI